jgi:hypothetical protein
MELLARRLLPRTDALAVLGRQRRGVLTIKKFTRPESARTPAKPKAAARKAAVVSVDKEDGVATDDVPAAASSSTVRLAKRIAMSGLCSRREAEKRIQSFDVTVNGRVVADVATTVDVLKDVVAVDGRVLTKTQKVKIWMANKLKGVSRGTC